MIGHKFKEASTLGVPGALVECVFLSCDVDAVACLVCGWVCRVCLIIITTLEAAEVYTLFPKNANIEVLAEQPSTPATVLVDTLAMAGHREDVLLIQALSKLEVCQIAIAKVKVISREEDRLTDVEEMALLQCDLETAKLAPALNSLSHSIKSFTEYISGLASADLAKDPLVKYKFPEAVKGLTDICENEMQLAIDRWKDVLAGACTEIKKVFPPSWKEKSIKQYDVDFVKSKLLVQSVVDKLGNHYGPIGQWLRSLDKDCMEPIRVAFESRWEEELKECRTVITDAVELTCTILSYNILTFKMPKQTSAMRRQSIKDLRKKLKSKFGKACEIPEEVASRLTEAISGK